ncbi:MAG TPA: hypothetical protein VKV15_19325 [Bryobacteraceae bacterium]|nr:hypothetical protein [Bryobacteraceae bacterium]
MSDDVFELVEQTLENDGPDAALDLLAERFLEEKRYPQLFEARLMKKRHQLGLPLLMSELPEDLPSEPRKSYEDAFIAAAREVGGLFLANGDIERAWPYFRALGDSAPVAEAIERVQLAEGMERVIEIALHERVNPRRGFELILGHYGICRAIGFYEQYPDARTRPDCLKLLVRTLHSELVEGLKRTITRAEGSAPETSSVPELIAGREWMFEDNNYYVDTSHLIAILRYSLDLQEPDMLRLALELSSYGTHLGPMFNYKVDPPFENVYVDHAVYLRALLGEQIEEAVAHFRKKLDESNLEEIGSAPAQVLVGLLTRLGRYSEAADVFLAHLKDLEPSLLACPTALDLCRMAADWDRVKQLAREKNDTLSYLAASAQAEQHSPSHR